MTLSCTSRSRVWLDHPKEETVRVLGAVKPGRYRRLHDPAHLLAEAVHQANAYNEKITVANLSCCEQARTADLIAFSPLFVHRNSGAKAGDTSCNKSESTMMKIRESIKDILSS